jgi:hypothetical protein
MGAGPWIQAYNSGGSQTGAVPLSAVTGLYPVDLGSWAIEATGVSATGGGTVYVATGIDSEADALTRIATILSGAQASTVSTPALVNGNP